MHYGIEKKVAVVFAASKGLGKATAMTLAREGCRLAICSRNQANIESAAEEIRSETGGNVLTAQVDVENASQISAFLKKVRSSFHP